MPRPSATITVVCIYSPSWVVSWSIIPKVKASAQFNHKLSYIYIYISQYIQPIDRSWLILNWWLDTVLISVIWTPIIYVALTLQPVICSLNTTLSFVCYLFKYYKIEEAINPSLITDVLEGYYWWVWRTA